MSAVAERTSNEIWTCDRCEMTVQWMPGHERPKRPAHWAKKNGRMHCLSCRREVAAETSVKNLPEGTPLTKRAQVMAEARLDFEVNRDPDRNDGEIAKICKSSIPSVQKARKRVGVA